MGKGEGAVYPGALARIDIVESLHQDMEEGIEVRDCSGKILLMHAAKAGALLVVTKC